MSTSDRRTFLKLMGTPALAAAVPNGFFREFKSAGSGAGGANITVVASSDPDGSHVSLEIANHSTRVAVVAVADKYRCRSTDVSLNPGETETLKWPLARTANWYDLVVTVAGDSRFEYHCAGHVETGRDSISDPALGGLDCRD